MKRLEGSRLIWGNLLPIEEPHLIARYARALMAFGFEMPALARFEIDMTGWSREIADALGDRSYLDPTGVSRRFIVLSPAQAQLPVVNSAFSNTAELMAEFFRANARSINALTIKDVIYGEIEDSIASVDTMDDLLAIEQVRFDVMSADDTVRNAVELRALADRIENEPDAWREEATLQRMVELAQTTGDIRRTTLVPDKLVFRHEAFWSSHFGGVYVFHGDEDEGGRLTVVADPAAPGFRRSRPWQVAYIDINDVSAVFDFLSRSRRLEMPRDSWVEPSGYLVHRAAMALRSAVIDRAPGLDPFSMAESDIRAFMSRYGDEVRRDGIYPFLIDARKRVARDGHLDPATIDVPEWRFAVVRARPDGKDRWLVNRLISEFVPYDFVSTFVFHKPRFYERYERIDDSLRDGVVATLESGYVADKAGYRQRMYGFV